MQVKDMAIEELQSLIRDTVNDTLDQYFADVEEDNNIKDSFKQSLLEIRSKRLAGRVTISVDDVYQKYQIEK